MGTSWHKDNPSNFKIEVLRLMPMSSQSSLSVQASMILDDGALYTIIELNLESEHVVSSMNLGVQVGGIEIACMTH